MQIRRDWLGNAAVASGDNGRPAIAASRHCARTMPKKIVTRRSAIHGNGMFAVETIAKGERLIEYKGRAAPTKTWMPATAATSKAGIPSCSPSTTTR